MKEYAKLLTKASPTYAIVIFVTGGSICFGFT